MATTLKPRSRFRELEKGEVFGCFTVLRISSPRGEPRYKVRTSCCQQEVIRGLQALLNALPYCVNCRWKARKQKQQTEVIP